MRDWTKSETLKMGKINWQIFTQSLPNTCFPVLPAQLMSPSLCPSSALETCSVEWIPGFLQLQPGPRSHSKNPRGHREVLGVLATQNKNVPTTVPPQKGQWLDMCSLLCNGIFQMLYKPLKKKTAYPQFPDNVWLV